MFLMFRDGLTMGVGTSTGQVLLYDLRANKPIRTKVDFIFVLFFFWGGGIFIQRKMWKYVYYIVNFSRLEISLKCYGQGS